MLNATPAVVIAMGPMLQVGLDQTAFGLMLMWMGMCAMAVQLIIFKKIQPKIGCGMRAATIMRTDAAMSCGRLRRSVAVALPALVLEPGSVVQWGISRYRLCLCDTPALLCELASLGKPALSLLFRTASYRPSFDIVRAACTYPAPSAQRVAHRRP